MNTLFKNSLLFNRCYIKRLITWVSHPLHSTVVDFRGEGFSHVLLRIRIPAEHTTDYYNARKKNHRIPLTTVAGSGASVPATPRGPLAERFGRRCLVFRRTWWKVYADVVVVVVSHADPATESRGWIRARASSRFHRESTGLRARRPGRPSCPLAVNRAVGHSNPRAGARCSSMLRRRVVAIPRLALTDIRGLSRNTNVSRICADLQIDLNLTLHSPLRHARNEDANGSASASVPPCRVDTETTSSRHSNHRPRDP